MKRKPKRPSPAILNLLATLVRQVEATAGLTKTSFAELVNYLRYVSMRRDWQEQYKEANKDGGGIPGDMSPKDDFEEEKALIIDDPEEALTDLENLKEIAERYDPHFNDAYNDDHKL